MAAIQAEGGDKVVTVRGEVDAYSAPQLRACLEEVAGSGQRRIVVDVSAMRFIDSSGVGVLVASIKRLRPDGRTLVLRRPTRQMTKILEITGLRDLVAVD
ncbi:MAG: STAS domain-containing protein [Actinomycetota bacterium]|nr:STAS domain-containing protein [Actinomycetota bacterium]